MLPSIRFMRDSRLAHYSRSAVLALIVWSLLRVVLWGVVGPAQLSPQQTATAFLYGLWFDGWTLAYLVAPALILAALIPNRWRNGRPGMILRGIALWMVLSALFIGAAAEYLFWQEFSTRFNFIAVDYLIYTHEVVDNILQSYPVGSILMGISGLAAVLAFLLRERIGNARRPLSWRERLILVLTAIGLPIASYAVANVDQMNVSGNPYANELSGNGLFTLAAALRRNELDYDRFYRTIPHAEAVEILAKLAGDDAAANANAERLGPFQRRPKNIVLVSVESLSADFVGSYGDPRGLTPNLDRLAERGLKFTRMFATGTRTVRGLEALSLGTPPIPGQAIVRRPHNDHLTTVGQILARQDYATFFLYGGYGYFDNMADYFAGNDYTVVDRTDFPPESISFENAWGVADEVLFANALRVLDETVAQKKNFFAHIMTTSNHQPYTYPDGRIDRPSPGGRSGAVKYTDFALGQFIDRASTKAWFKDTLFVIVADHCAAVAGNTKLPVAKYHIPMVFYAPDMLKPGNHTRMASQIDLPPTLLDLLGIPREKMFYGESLFTKETVTPRAFISNYQELGYYKNDVLTVLSPKRKVEAFQIDPKTFAATPIAPSPALMTEAIAYYQTASRAYRDGALRMDHHTKQ